MAHPQPTGSKPMTDTSEATIRAGIARWVEKRLSGTVRDIVRLERWRPSWNVAAETPVGEIKLHFRSDRGAGLETRPLRAEYEVLRLLDEEGVPVPKIYGWCEDPEAIVMAALDDHPFHGGADIDPALHAMIEAYMAILARIHCIDTAKAAAAGLAIPKTAEDIALAYFRLADAAYLKGKAGPEPMIEFFRSWITRNVPMHRTRAVLLVADAPQFFHDGTAITAIYDLEMAHVGDPMMDLASIRVRDINEPIGGIATLIEAYRIASGEPIDWSVLQFHTIVSFMAVPMMTGATLRGMHPHPAFVEYLSWDLGASRAAIETLAEVQGIALDPVASLTPQLTRHGEALADLVAVAEKQPPPDGLLREDRVLSLARYAKRADEIGPAIDRLEIAEIAALIGHTPGSIEEAHAALEAFVLAQGERHEAALIRLFHASTMRRLQLLEGYPGPIVTRGLGKAR